MGKKNKREKKRTFPQILIGKKFERFVNCSRRTSCTCFTFVFLSKNTHQFTGALQEAQVPGQDGRELRHAGRPSAGEVAGLQDHHARREQGEPHELHRQRARKMVSKTFTLTGHFYFYQSNILSWLWVLLQHCLRSGSHFRCLWLVLSSTKEWFFFSIKLTWPELIMWY